MQRRKAMAPLSPKPARYAASVEAGQHAPIRKIGLGTLKDKIRIGENFDSPLPDDAADGKKRRSTLLSQAAQSEIASRCSDRATVIARQTSMRSKDHDDCCAKLRDVAPYGHAIESLSR
jgi:hypothetical protein